MDDLQQDVPEQVGSLSAWLPPQARLQSTLPRSVQPREALTPTPSQPIPIPSRPQWRDRRSQSHNLFKPCTDNFACPHLGTTPSGSGDQRAIGQLPGQLINPLESIESFTTAPSSHLEPLPGSVPRTPADGLLVDGSAGEPSACWAAHCYSSNRETCTNPRDVPRKPVDRLLDGYQITAGPLGPAASLPIQGAQAPMGLANLCKALSSPAAHNAREASLANPTPRSGGGTTATAAAAGRRKAAVSGLSEAFDAAKAIAAFERSTAWSAALHGDGPDGRVGGGCLGLNCLAFHVTAFHVTARHAARNC